MIGRKVWGLESLKQARQSSFHDIIGLGAIVLILGGFGMFLPTIMVSVFPPAELTKIQGWLFLAPSPTTWAVAFGTLVMILIVLLRQDELALTLIIATKICVDRYLGLTLVGHFMAIVLLVVFFWARSSKHPWIEPRALWLWGLFLAVALFPAFHGLNLTDSLGYYLDSILGSLIIFWLGTLLAHDMISVRRFFMIFSVFATLMALHIIIQAKTGVFLFKSSRYDLFLNLSNNYQLGDTGVYRLSSFLGDPDTAGGFFSIVLFIPLGLFVASSSVLGKVFHLIQVLLIVVALFFCYSGGGWVTASVGLIAFVIFVGRTRYRFLISMLVSTIVGVIVIVFPYQVSVQIHHLTAPDESSLRIGAWQTGINVIRAFPFTGVGLGRYVYYDRSQPYRVAAQYLPLYHPHNAFLELAALGGIQLSFIFIALLVFSMYFALRNWVSADVQARSLLAGGITVVVAVTVNSIANPAWTIIPLASVGWLILGVISSPLLAKTLQREKAPEGRTIIKRQVDRRRSYAHVS